MLASDSFSLSVLHRCCPSKKPPPRLKESLGYYVHIYIPLPHRCGCLHRCKWEGYSPTSQTALQVPLRILFGVTILEIVRTQSARFLPSCFGIGGGREVRTLDLTIKSRLLCQLSYEPKFRISLPALARRRLYGVAASLNLYHFNRIGSLHSVALGLEPKSSHYKYDALLIKLYDNGAHPVPRTRNLPIIGRHN